MLTVGAFEAKAKIPELLDKVAKDESVLISREDKRQDLAEIKSFRENCKTGKVDIEALITEDHP